MFVLLMLLLAFFCMTSKTLMAQSGLGPSTLHSSSMSSITALASTATTSTARTSTARHRHTCGSDSASLVVNIADHLPADCTWSHIAVVPSVQRVPAQQLSAAHHLDQWEAPPLIVANLHWQTIVHHDQLQTQRHSIRTDTTT